MKSISDRESDKLDELDLSDLFKLVDKIGSKRYHKLTLQDLIDYQKYDGWRYISGDSKLGSTKESRVWVDQNSTSSCPICGDYHQVRGGKNIDHKLPRSQYPWLSLNFNNFWVICRECNFEKAEMHWYEYERYMLKNYPDRYQIVYDERPNRLLRSLVVTTN